MGEGVLIDALVVRVADERLMRPVVGTAGPSRQLIYLVVVRTMPCCCVVHLGTVVGGCKKLQCFVGDNLVSVSIP